MSKTKSGFEHRREKSEDGVVLRQYELLIDEGDYFMHVKKIEKAVDCYSRAIELQADDEHCLVARSRCYLMEGFVDKALSDAEASLGYNPKNPKGIFQKAEVLYFMGEFEKALILYHRGHRARPEMEVFRLGIQKCEEAINNCVGNPETIRLNLNCELSYFFQNEENSKKKRPNERITKKKMILDSKETKIERKPCLTNPKTVKQLLGELYTDRLYLENLLSEEESMSKKTQNSELIRELAVNGLNYLDDRSDFWQKEKPMYSRQKRHVLRLSRESSSKVNQKSDIIKYVVSTLDEIDTKQSRAEHRNAITLCSHLIKQIERWSENDLPNRLDILANIYCLVGNSYLEMGLYEKSLEYHEKDKAIGKQYKLDEAISRSIDNIGRVYAKWGQFKKAIEIWQEKITISKSALESTWLHHEMGRCYLELQDYGRAMDFGEKSSDFAREASDNTWQMNASILVAQAAMKSKKFSTAIENFDKALRYSKILQNSDAEEAIKNAIVEINKSIIEEERQGQKERLDITDSCDSIDEPFTVKNDTTIDTKLPLIFDEDGPKSVVALDINTIDDIQDSKELVDMQANESLTDQETQEIIYNTPEDEEFEEKIQITNERVLSEIEEEPIETISIEN